MPQFGPSRHIAAPRDLGRKRGIAEVDARPSIAEGDAIDPERTFVALLVISKTAPHKPM
jgi:hypothetical protein